MYNVPILVFIVNGIIFNLSILLMDEQIGMIFFSDLTFTLLTLILSLGSIAFLLGVLVSVRYFLPETKQAVKQQIEYETLDLETVDVINQSSLENFESCLNLLEDINGYVDIMNENQLRMLGEKLRQVFIQLEAIEIQELKDMEREMRSGQEVESEEEEGDTLIESNADLDEGPSEGDSGDIPGISYQEQEQEGEDLNEEEGTETANSGDEKNDGSEEVLEEDDSK